MRLRGGGARGGVSDLFDVYLVQVDIHLRVRVTDCHRARFVGF